jgi:hypothetical protein
MGVESIGQTRCTLPYLYSERPTQNFKTKSSRMLNYFFSIVNIQIRKLAGFLTEMKEVRQND